MKRLVLRWLGLLAFVAVLAVAFVMLGDWQLDRLDQRKGKNAHVEANQAQAVQPYDQVLGSAIRLEQEWLRVSLRGTFDADNQFLVRYRSAAGQQGAEVVTPLQTTDGRWVLIDRGFIARTNAQPEPSVLPAPPSGEVEVLGYVRKTEVGKAGATDPVESKVRLINPPAISKALGRDFVDGYVSLISVTPSQSTDLQLLKPPVLDEGPHFWYAVQWFCFTAIALGGFVILVRADLRDRKKRLAREAAAAAAAAEVTV